MVIDCAFGNGGLLHIQVADNDIGIAPSLLNRLFAYGFTTRPEFNRVSLAPSVPKYQVD